MHGSELVRDALLQDRHGLPVIAVRDGRIHQANLAARALLGPLAAGAPLDALFDDRCRAKLHAFLSEASSGSAVELELTRAVRPPENVTFVLLDVGSEKLLVARAGAIGYTESAAAKLLAANAHLANVTRELAKAQEAERRLHVEAASLYAAADLQRTWLERVVDQMPVGVLLYDERGRLKTTNHGVAALSSEATDPFGNASPIDPRGTDGCALPPERWPLYRALVERETVREELFVRRQSHELVPVAMSAAPVLDASGRLSGAMVIVQDISARKELERLREEWGAIVAHDLRQPVSTITMSVDATLLDAGAELPTRVGAPSSGSDPRRAAWTA